MAYSDEFKANALIKLAANKNDYDTTADEIGVSPRTLRRWSNGTNVKKSQKQPGFDIPAVENVNSLTVADYLEQAIKQMLANIPDKMRGNDWGVAIGILMDKWLLLSDQPTERVETITRYLDELPEDEYEDVIREAERIIRGAGGGDAAGGG